MLELAFGEALKDDHLGLDVGQDLAVDEVVDLLVVADEDEDEARAGLLTPVYQLLRVELPRPATGAGPNQVIALLQRDEEALTGLLSQLGSCLLLG